jgi:hypothetical protein
MINRVTGEVCFRSGLHIRPHDTVQSTLDGRENQPKIRTQNLSLKGWKRHVLGLHTSEHGTFEVEVLSADEERIHVVLLAHQHSFYERNTPEDADRRAFHEGVIHLDLAGQKEFTWGEVLCRLESPANQDWLVIAYSREANVPLPAKEILLQLRAHENT